VIAIGTDLPRVLIVVLVVLQIAELAVVLPPKDREDQVLGDPYGVLPDRVPTRLAMPEPRVGSDIGRPLRAQVVATGVFGIGTC
jgi:hypothetical protein